MLYFLTKRLNLKKKIYAKAGIDEYWIVDLKNTKLVVFREPSGDGYKIKAILDKGAIAPRAFPDIQLKLERILLTR